MERFLCGLAAPGREGGGKESFRQGGFIAVFDGHEKKRECS